MAIPTYDKLLRPVLSLAEKEPITRRAATAAMTQLFSLSEEEAEKRLPSGGSTQIGNRTGWAMTFLTKAKLIEKIARATYRVTQAGRDFLVSHPTEITVTDLRKIEGWEAAWNTGTKHRQTDKSANISELVVASNETATPYEIIDREVAALRADLRDRLLQTILDQSPEFFEQLVLDVLIAMGYGGSREDAAHRMGRSGDEGIDGRINQDSLGLDQILVQAKRYHPDNVINRQTIQAFIGSLAGQGVNKGIFITTSSFGESAQEFVLRGAATKIVLVDGSQLIDLMLRHGIGVRVAQNYQIHELDQNYFEESE
jgi:restriction system protein